MSEDTGSTIRFTTTDPITVLQAKLRVDQDRQARLQIEGRDLAARMGEVRDQLNDVTTSIAHTRGLLGLADRADRAARAAREAATAKAAAANSQTTTTAKRAATKKGPTTP